MNFKDQESPEKLRGGYYTDTDVAEFLTSWALRKRPSRVLEPSCGDGVFIDAIANLSPRNGSKIIGIELFQDGANESRKKAAIHKNVSATIYNTDFLEWVLRRLNTDNNKVDAVVGNPPFIRYQYLPQDVQSRAQRIFELTHLKFTKHTNAWVPFVIGAMQLLAPGGRLAMVVPAELLHVLHAHGLRQYLCLICRKILVLDPEDLLFGKVLQGAVLLMAEKKQTAAEPFLGLAVKTVRGRDILNEDADRIFANARFVNGETCEGKWMRAFLSPDELDVLRACESSEHFARFADVASVDVGIVTGANKFFLVPDSVVRDYELEEYAYPMFGRSDHVAGVVYDRNQHKNNKKAGKPSNLLYFNGYKYGQLNTGAKSYIKYGEKLGLHRRYKTSIRNPWFSVPSVYATTVGMLKRSHDFPRLIRNDVGAFTTDTAYRIKEKGLSADQLVAGFVNSATALTAELEGRHYGGGVLELVPSEIEKLLVPKINLKRNDVRHLDRLIKDKEDPRRVFEVQDAHVLSAAGISLEDQKCLTRAWYRLRCRRHRVESQS